MPRSRLFGIPHKNPRRFPDDAAIACVAAHHEKTQPKMVCNFGKWFIGGGASGRTVVGKYWPSNKLSRYIPRLRLGQIPRSQESPANISLVIREAPWQRWDVDAERV